MRRYMHKKFGYITHNNYVALSYYSYTYINFTRYNFIMRRAPVRTQLISAKATSQQPVSIEIFFRNRWKRERTGREEEEEEKEE